MGSRRAHLASALAAALLLPALLAPVPARAQIPDIPCEVGRWGGGGYVLPSRGERDWVEPETPELTLSAIWDRYTFDERDGEGIPTVRVDLLTTTLQVAWAGHEGRQFEALVGLPMLWVEDDDTGFTASGIGDLALGFSVGLHPDGDRWRGLLELLVTAPTGDDDDGLGFGDWTEYLGLRLDVALGDGTVSETPKYRLEVAGGVRNVEVNHDLSQAIFQVVFVRSWERAWLELGLTGSREIGGSVDLPGGGTRDPVEQWVLDAEARFDLGGDDPSWKLILGARSELSNDGLADGLTPFVGFQVVLP